MKTSRTLASAVAIAALTAATAGVVRADPPQVGTVFVIAMENHNWTVNGAGYNGSNLAIENNPAAPFINSLVNGTATTVDTTQVSYAMNYNQPGQSEHPSEPNYVWAEAGTNFNPIATGVATNTNKGSIIGNTINNDNDPSVASKNILTNVPHLTAQLNAAGITWQNYQEDYQILNATTATGGSPTVSKSGTTGPVSNPYYGTTQYNYAAKHDPMAFFADTQTQNVNTFDQLRTNITADTGPGAVNNFGRYNWITPNQFDDQHSAIAGTFTYHGTAYTGDQSAIATGDNFLATIVPQIMATDAYKNNGAIVLWWDETEGGDTAGFTTPEIVLSPLAHPNVAGVPYGSTVTMNHSSDIRTMEELFGLSFIDNAIPTSEAFQNVAGQYATVVGSNDLSDLFAAGAIPAPVPEPASLAMLSAAGLLLFTRGRRAPKAKA